METKKSKKANLERFRVVLFQTGLVISLLFVITLLSWTFKVEKPFVPPPDTAWIDMFIDPVVREPLQKKPEAPKPQQSEPKPIVDIFKATDDATEPDEPDKPETVTDPEPALTMTKPREADTNEPPPPVIYAQKMPVYKNCNRLKDEKARRKCTNKRLTEEISDKLWNKNKNKVTGIIEVSFVVDKTGKVTDVKIKKSLDPYLDNEVLKVVQAIDGFEPGSNNGIPVDVIYTWPFSFTLRN